MTTTGIKVPAICEPDLQNQPVASRLAVIIDVLLGLVAATSVPVPPTPVPATIANGGNYNTGVMPITGNSLAASANLSQNGSLVLQRYIDAAGTIPIGAAITQALVGGTLGTVAVNDGLPAASWTVQVNNTGGALGNLTQFALLEKK